MIKTIKFFTNIDFMNTLQIHYCDFNPIIWAETCLKLIAQNPLALCILQICLN